MTIELETIKRYLQESQIEADLEIQHYKTYPRSSYFLTAKWLWELWQHEGFDDVEILDEEEKRTKCDILSMWTTYYELPQVDVEKSKRCKLVPFSYGNLYFLAFGGGGQDLSPRLDAYQALVDCTIDPSSQILKPLMRQYCEFIIGKDLYQEVLDIVTLTNPCVLIKPR